MNKKKLICTALVSVLCILLASSVVCLGVSADTALDVIYSGYSQITASRLVSFTNDEIGLSSAQNKVMWDGAVASYGTPAIWALVNNSAAFEPFDYELAFDSSGEVSYWVCPNYTVTFHAHAEDVEVSYISEFGKTTVPDYEYSWTNDSGMHSSGAEITYNIQVFADSTQGTDVTSPPSRVKFRFYGQTYSNAGVDADAYPMFVPQAYSDLKTAVEAVEELKDYLSNPPPEHESNMSRWEGELSRFEGEMSIEQSMQENVLSAVESLYGDNSIPVEISNGYEDAGVRLDEYKSSEAFSLFSFIQYLWTVHPMMSTMVSVVVVLAVTTVIIRLS